MTMNLNDYREMTVEEFIEAVEEQETWDMTEPEAYREALDDYGLDFDSYDDPDMMWSDFLEAVEK